MQKVQICEVALNSKDCAQHLNRSSGPTHTLTFQRITITLGPPKCSLLCRTLSFCVLCPPRCQSRCVDLTTLIASGECPWCGLKIRGRNINPLVETMLWMMIRLDPVKSAQSMMRLHKLKAVQDAVKAIDTPPPQPMFGLSLCSTCELRLQPQPNGAQCNSALIIRSLQLENSELWRLELRESRPIHHV